MSKTSRVAATANPAKKYTTKPSRPDARPYYCGGCIPWASASACWNSFMIAPTFTFVFIYFETHRSTQLNSPTASSSSTKCGTHFRKQILEREVNKAWVASICSSCCICSISLWSEFPLPNKDIVRFCEVY